MSTIVWQTESKVLSHSYGNDALAIDARGGDAYEYHAAKHLSHSFDVVFDDSAVRTTTTGSFSYWRQLGKSEIQGAAFIKSPSVIVHGRTHRNAVDIGMVHHIYLSQKKSSTKGRLSLRMLQHNLRKLDTVVVCSQFWQDYMRGIGCRDVRIIYNAFDPGEFEVTEASVDQFLEKNSIPRDNPIVYLGLADPSKGVADAYGSLKDCGYTLVMTGKAGRLDLPVRHFALDRSDYVTLLAASDLVIAMSRVEEGWSRIAHEALLCRTPVIGSGTGGMAELLSGAGQRICNRCEDLPAVAAEVLANREEYRANGYEFAKRFTLDRFQNEWLTLMEDVLG